MSDKLDKRLLAYALTAGASVLAAAQVADAEIVHTPDPHDITDSGAIPIDLDGDLNTDFVLSINTTGPNITPFPPGGEGFFLTYSVRRTADITGSANAGVGNQFYSASQGSIGPGGSFQSQRQLAFAEFKVYRNEFYSVNYNNSLGGFFLNQGPGILGLRFEINGSTHFGWARVEVSGGEGSLTVALTDFAYEACADTAIHPGAETSGIQCAAVPAPAPLGLLALGAAGLAAWRLRRRDGE